MSTAQIGPWVLVACALGVILLCCWLLMKAFGASAKEEPNPFLMIAGLVLCFVLGLHPAFYIIVVLGYAIRYYMWKSKKAKKPRQKPVKTVESSGDDVTDFFNKYS